MALEEFLWRWKDCVLVAAPSLAAFLSFPRWNAWRARPPASRSQASRKHLLDEHTPARSVFNWHLILTNALFK
jgi:hypothetical protein